MSFTTESRVSISEMKIEEIEKTEDVSRVLDFVRRRETNIWKAASQTISDTKKLKDW